MVESAHPLQGARRGKRPDAFREVPPVPAVLLPGRDATPALPGATAVAFPPLPVPWQARAVEVPVALLALLAGLPLMLVIAVIIKLGSRGPVLFRQQRVGLGGRPFTFVKFRTLYADARQRWPELYAYRYTDEQLAGLHFKVVDDPRVTPQGRWLRKSSLDELPNFWNVLLGNVALVGPRPEIPEMLQYYRGEMLSKFSVRPGITGLAQISGRGRLSFHDTVRLDVEYVRRKSLRFDLAILWRTVRMVLFRVGAF